MKRPPVPVFVRLEVLFNKLMLFIALLLFLPFVSMVDGLYTTLLINWQYRGFHSFAALSLLPSQSLLHEP
jgi:hypothetical protein